MAIEWMLPTAKGAYDNRKHLLNGWEKFIAKILGSKHRIAFVGPGGIGKTVLLDYITGEANKLGYKLPAKSRKSEKGKAKALGSRLALIVAPGQGGPQVDTFNEVFIDKPVDGIVFVAGEGFVTLRNSKAIEHNVSQGYKTIEQWRALSKGTELDSLKEVVSMIRSAQAKSRKPCWLLVVVTKMDLYFNEINKSEEYYSPYGSSEFSSLLNRLQAQLGLDNFEWDAVPVCSQLDDFHWGAEVAKSDFDDSKRNQYLAQMIERMGELCK